MNFRKAILIYLLKTLNEFVAPLFLIFITRCLLKAIDPSIIKPLEINFSAEIFSFKGKVSIIDLIIVIYWIYFTKRVVCRSTVITKHYHLFLSKLRQSAEEE